MPFYLKKQQQSNDKHTTMTTTAGTATTTNTYDDGHINNNTTVTVITISSIFEPDFAVETPSGLFTVIRKRDAQMLKMPEAAPKAV